MIEVDNILIEVINKSNNPLPKYETKGASGLDIRAFFVRENLNFSDGVDTMLIKPQERRLIKTGLFVGIPEGYEIQIRSRSGLSYKQGVVVLNSPGTIDSDFTGEIGVILINTSNENFHIKSGDKIAQMVLQKVETVSWVETKTLKETDRGGKGYGSTGIS